MTIDAYTDEPASPRPPADDDAWSTVDQASPRPANDHYVDDKASKRQASDWRQRGPRSAWSVVCVVVRGPSVISAMSTHLHLRTTHYLVVVVVFASPPSSPTVWPSPQWLNDSTADLRCCDHAKEIVFSDPRRRALRTLRPQDTSAPIFGAEVSRTLRHRNVSRHFGKVRQANSRRIGLRRVHADPRVQDLVQLLRHITPVAQHSSVDVTSGTTVAGRLAAWRCRARTMATRRSPVYQATRSTD